MTNKKVALSLALLLTSTAFAGGAGPRAAAPASVAVTPIRTSSATSVLSVADLQRTGTFPVLMSQQGRVLARLSGPTVTLAAGSPEARYLVVTRDGQTLRYTLDRPIMPGRTVTLNEITVVRGSEVRTTPVTSAAPPPRTQPTAPRPAITPAPTAPQGNVQVEAPSTPARAAAAPGKVTICHPTSSTSNPYTLITVSTNALETHLAQGGFVSSEAQGCLTEVRPVNAANPAAPSTPGKAKSVDGGTGAMPATAANPNGASGEASEAGKVTICHPTASASNPYTLITVSTNALETHLAQGGFVSSEAQGCPAGVQPGNSAGPATPANPGNGNNGNGATPATPATPANPGNGNGATPATPAQPGKGK